MIRASYFFGHEEGQERCFFCGETCGHTFLTKDYVKDTFTNRDIIQFPDSQYVCSGCVESLGNGSYDEMGMIDGSVKIRKNARGMSPRMYSWVLTEKERLSATKAHIKELREIILNPPDPPFAIVLADSGQKQIIFRCPVSHDRDNYPVLLEEDVIIVSIIDLQNILKCATRLSAAVGKVALLNPEQINVVTRVFEYYGDLGFYEEWLKICRQPLAKLAAWLCKNKEEASLEYPSLVSRTVSTGDGGVSKSKSTVRGAKQRRDKEPLCEVSLFAA